MYQTVNTPEIKEFILKHRSWFWYTPEAKKEDISLELLVETTLNYGNMDEVKALFRILGLKEISRIFHNADGRKKMNYYPEVYNFFSLLFSRYA